MAFFRENRSQTNRCTQKKNSGDWTRLFSMLVTPMLPGRENVISGHRSRSPPGVLRAPRSVDRVLPSRKLRLPRSEFSTRPAGVQQSVTQCSGKWRRHRIKIETARCKFAENYNVLRQFYSVREFKVAASRRHVRERSTHHSAMFIEVRIQSLNCLVICWSLLITCVRFSFNFGGFQSIFLILCGARLILKFCVITLVKYFQKCDRN